MNRINQRIVEWAQEMHRRGAFSLDTEATGGSFQDEVCDLGIVRAGTGEILYDGLLRPEKEMNPYAQKVHKITSGQLRTAPVFADEAARISRIMDGAVIVAYNARYDERMMRQTFERYGIPMPRVTFVCAMGKYAEYVLVKRPNAGKTSLTKACGEMKCAAGSHRAVTDALAQARLIYRMANSFVPIVESDAAAAAPFSPSRQSSSSSSRQYYGRRSNW